MRQTYKKKQIKLLTVRRVELVNSAVILKQKKKTE